MIGPILLFDGTTHPTPDLLPGCHRLEFLGNSSSRGKQLQRADGSTIQPWIDQRTGVADWNALRETLERIPERTPVSMNVESAALPISRLVHVGGGKISRRSIAGYIDTALRFAEMARRRGLIVLSPFEAVTEAYHPAIETERLTELQIAVDLMIGLDEIVSQNNDELQAIYDASDGIAARVYVPESAQVREIGIVTRRNIGEARRVSKGKPIVAAVRPDLLTAEEMAAQARILIDQRVDAVAFWAGMDETGANQGPARAMARLMQ